MRYHGPLSYRGVKIFGLLFLFLGLISEFVPILVELYGGESTTVEWLAQVFSWLQQASLPLILVSAFCIILNTEQAIKPIVLVYAICALLIYGGTMFVFWHYLVPIIGMVYPELSGADLYIKANELVVGDLGDIVNYNVFLDLALCTLFYFFLIYKPAKLSARGLKIFRCCAILPILYVLGSIVVYGLYKNGVITLDVAGLAALVCRAPAVYLVFFALTLFLKFRQVLYLKYVGNIDQYNAYMASNKNPWHFSLFCSCILAIVSLVDFLLSLVPGATNFAIGRSYMLFLAIPFVLLMRYTKNYQNKSVDVMLPIVLIALIAFVIIEVVFKFVVNMA